MRTESPPDESTKAFGVYVHIPFCRHRCDYCAFATFTDRDHLIVEYLDAVRTDIEVAVAGGMPRATSIFVGGGTPTRVAPEMLTEVLARIPTVHGAEITIECNPDDCDDHLMSVYRQGGVNRISLGVQSMKSHVLASLGRTHDSANVVRAIDAARRQGITNINLDVIYGAHGESLTDWRSTLDRVVALDPDHVSAYGLTVEPGTALAQDPARYPDDDVQADMYDAADARLTAAGLTNYEISNWARPGFECQHNLLYWRQGDYRGFGSAAHSHERGRRWWNVRTPDRYIESIRTGASAESAHEILDDDARRVEALQLAIRMRDGVPEEAFTSQDRETLDEFLEKTDGGLVRLNRKGRLLANEISVRLR